MEASQFSYFHKSELWPLLINNYIISGSWPDDPKENPTGGGQQTPRLHHLHWLAACVVRRLNTG